MGTGVVESRERLGRLVGLPLEASEFSWETHHALARVLDFDGWCLIGLDPRTRVRTSQFGGRGTERTADMARNEAVMKDVNKYEELATAVTPAAWLSDEHPGARSSFRLHEILRPQGFGSELRLVLRDRHGCWGALVLFREDRRRAFDDGDVEAVCQVAGVLRDALRAFPIRPIAARGPAPADGLVFLTPDNGILSMSGETQVWLDELVPGGEDQTYASDVTRVLFDVAHAVRRGDPGGASTCLRTVRGRWLRVQAMPVQLGGADVAVVLQPATILQLLDTLAAHSRLTPRERQVLELVLRGHATKNIARALGLSPFTVDDHLKSVYRKCRVSGREQLVGSLV